MNQSRLLFLLTLIIFLLPSVYASCEEGQIDINTASLVELDNLTGIGPVKAQAIMDARPFETVDDLIRVSGIGEVTLEGIKSQGLACVDNSDEEIVPDSEQVDITINITKMDYLKMGVEESRTLEPINLDSEVIKTADSEEVKSIIALYGLVAFGILLCLLFLLRKKKNGLA